MSRSCGASIVFLSVLALACAPPPLQGPKQLRVTSGDPVDNGGVISLAWTPSPGADEYEIEGSADGQSWVKVYGKYIPASTSSVDVSPADLPELNTYRLRIRALRRTEDPISHEVRTEASLYSDEALRTVGLWFPVEDPPMFRTVYEGLSLHWVQGTSHPDASMLVERLDRFGKFQPIAMLPASPDRQKHISFLDESAVEGQLYQYRITNVVGSAASKSIDDADDCEVFPARNFAATVDASGIHFTWESRSQRTANFVLRRAAGAGEQAWDMRDIIMTDGTVRAAVDAPPPLGAGTYTYTLSQYPEAGFGIGSGVGRALEVQSLPDPSLPSLAVRETLTLPAGQVLLARSGAMVVYQNIFSGRYTVLMQSQGQWVAHDLANTGVFAGPVALDAQGYPHAVFTARNQVSGGTVTHEWYDGTRWLTETVASLAEDPPNGNAVRLALDAQGVPALLWVRTNSNNSKSYVLATRGTSGWSVSPLGGFNPGDHPGTLAFTSDGTLFVAGYNWSTPNQYFEGALARLAPRGSITMVPIPGGQVYPGNAGDPPHMVLLPFDAHSVHVITQRNPGTAGYGTDDRLFTRTDAGWTTTPEILSAGQWAVGGQISAFLGSTSQTIKMVRLLVDVPPNQYFYLAPAYTRRTAPGSSVTVALGMGPPSGAGVDGAGQLHLFEQLDVDTVNATQTLVHYAD